MIETLKFYKDFPKEGINFIDIIPFLQSRKAFSEVIEALNKATTAPNVAAPEARAFLFAAPLLTAQGAVENIIPMRKSGKLPFNDGDLIEVKIEKPILSPERYRCRRTYRRYLRGHNLG